MAKCKLCEQRRERRGWAERFEKLEKLKNVSLLDDPPPPTPEYAEEGHLWWMLIGTLVGSLLLGFLLGFVTGAYTASPQPETTTEGGIDEP